MRRPGLRIPGLKRLDLAPVIVIVLVVAGWHFSVTRSDFVSDTLAPPGAVFIELGRLILDGEILRAAVATLLSTLLGLCLGAGLGVVVGIMAGISRPIAMAIRAPVELLRPLPAIALVPFMTIAFGLGLPMEVYVIAFAVFWPAIVLAQSAVYQVERQLLEVADALELGRVDRVVKIILPAIVPRLVVMLRFTAAIALLIAVTVELVSNPRGLGNEMMLAAEAFAPARMLAYLVVITLMGWMLNWMLVKAERRFGRA